MDFDFTPRVQQLRTQVSDFMDEYVVPTIPRWIAATNAGDSHPDFIEDLKALARDEGLWNLFLPGLADDEPGQRLTNLEYAPLAEIMGRVMWASEIFNCSAPDTGNMEILHLFATAEQRHQWLEPLLEGTIRSCFAMTEPDVASSDATNIMTSIRCSGDSYVINGRKWFSSGAANPRCTFAIVMGVTNPEESSHRRQSMVIVPLDTPGVEVVRNIPVVNYLSLEGHCEIIFKDVEVPVQNLILQEGAGFEIAQARLGPGRIHHCMRSIGQCELALELLCERAVERKTFGSYLHQHGTIADWIARSRIDIDQARLLVLKTAWMIDREGRAGGRQGNRHDQGDWCPGCRPRSRSGHAGLWRNGPHLRHSADEHLVLGSRPAHCRWSRRGTPPLNRPTGGTRCRVTTWLQRRVPDATRGPRGCPGLSCTGPVVC